MKLKANSIIGFIGLGVMGKSMARNLVKEGYKVIAYTRTKEKAQDILDEGVAWIETPEAITEKADIIITMVGYPSDVEQIYLGENGIVHTAKSGSFFIDMTTSTPTLAKKIYNEAKKKGIYSVDAPVSGGDIGAREGKLSIMVGGDEEVFDALQPIFQVLGSNIVYQGSAGAGQHTKMCNQIAIASNMLGVCEAVVYAEKAGLDPTTVLKSISSGAAGSWSLSNLAPRIIGGDFSPGFYIKHFIKDMKIALDEAEQMGMITPGLSLAKSIYEQLAEQGEENSGTQALYKYWK
ncbi:NAD(P)-dependent oxidoreductase [Robertmurraya korlensis]|uniref:NAD(P)-dependent oxidoreductase n=1 Tax=Robertmurraya korlensis TaxID=519977 RepID=UPI0020405D30|nr:NAD(P)-dependent oxidoreductase [Robertmurraya korlensis]MCM3603505.1 NAD(P)-dependent oxidoreductase [Robertmurraya korlensis]